MWTFFAAAFYLPFFTCVPCNGALKETPRESDSERQFDWAWQESGGPFDLYSPSPVLFPGRAIRRTLYWTLEPGAGRFDLLLGRERSL